MSQDVRDFETDRPFVLGSLAGLETFRELLVEHRGRVENELEAPVDVVLELLDLTIAQLRTIEARLEELHE